MARRWPVRAPPNGCAAARRPQYARTSGLGARAHSASIHSAASSRWPAARPVASPTSTQPHTSPPPLVRIPSALALDAANKSQTHCPNTRTQPPPAQRAPHTMGVIKRMLRRTSRKLLAKIAPPRQSHQLVLNSARDNTAHKHTAMAGLARPLSRRKASGLKRKLKKSSKESAISEALLLAAKNYLPPVQFHYVHGPNAQLSKNKCVARRTQSFCQALVFSNRVILPNERVYIKVLDVAKGWSGTIRFGFTSVDPATLAYRMPKHACPDMTNAGHTWARALADDVVKRNSVIHFSYNKDGFIHYGINNQDCGIFYANVKTDQNLWFIVDIYGLTAAVELIDPRVHNATSEIDFSQLDDELGINDRSTMYKSTSAMDDIFGRYGERTKKKRSRKAAARHAALIHAQWPLEGSIIADPLAIRFAHQQISAQLPNLNSIILPSAQQNIYSPMPAMTDSSPTLARNQNESHDYHQIMSNTFAKNDSYQPIRGSKLKSVGPMSNVPFQPGGTSSALNSSQASGRDIYDRTSADEQEICHQLESVQLHDSLPGQQQQVPNSSKLKSINIGAQTPVAAARRRQQQHQNNLTQTNFIRTPDTKDHQTKLIAHRVGLNKPLAASSSPSLTSPASALTARASNSQANVKPRARHSIKSQKSPSTSRDNNNNSPPSKDCPICFERPINCVLYQCGHMCTCYECGVKQWKTQSRTCPICRTIIKDVIKTYMS